VIDVDYLSETRTVIIKWRNETMNRNYKEKDVIGCLFDNLDRWRHHPKYQLERRADLFFSLYLNAVLEEKFNDEKDFCIADRLIPEFPVRKGTILEEFKEHPHRNMSYNIDYFTTTKDLKNIIFIELKTDQKSINEKQNYYLKKTMEKDFNSVLKGIMEICKATEAKSKYYRLLKELEYLGLIWNLNELDDLMGEAENKKIPSGNYNELINKIEINETSSKKHLFIIQPNGVGGGIITFKDFHAVVTNYKDEISNRFAEFLNSWPEEEVGGVIK